MLINLSDVFTTEGKIISQEIDLSTQKVKMFGDEVEFLEGSKAFITVTHISVGHAKLMLEGSVSVKLICDRCLAATTVTIPMEAENDAYAPGYVPEDSDEDVQLYMEEYLLNTDSLICDEITMQWPMKVLCSPGCKGICMKCGKNLNEGACKCDTFVPDPRMAALTDILNSMNKEV